MRTKDKDEKFMQLMQDFQNAHQELATFFTDEADDDSYMLIAPNIYPFEKSFDDYATGIRKWLQWSKRAIESMDTYPQFKTASDIHAWFLQLLHFGINFHPDTYFEEHVNFESTLIATFNAYLDECHNLCNKLDLDIYEIAQNALDEFNGKPPYTAK